ncbi:Ankyrin repeat domain containing protein [Pandoravirus neocaledonia]|uniref:Ankyrin repeat domain containing protein n=1 Tax=Pandoravirus neocaledonia TaxID=2107708 RepID=A0A2U7UDS9_9VIRU|nr:Ankyrin repeat domain containing protein [Pandoravirus neocaledonia]AVK76576.1 Ankyrin repeat domain containing protein [Pandoravirus neocaledonia]
MASINSALPAELLHAILLGSVPDPMRLVVSRVCALWRDIATCATSPSSDVAAVNEGIGKSIDAKERAENEGSQGRPDSQDKASVPGPWQRLEAYAAHTDALGLFEWFDTIGRPRSATACAEAAMTGRTSTLVWLVERGWPVDMEVYVAGAASKSQGPIKWLVARPGVPPLSDMVLRAALASGASVARLDWLVDRAGAPWPSQPVGALWSAGRSGKIDVVEWAARRGPQPPMWGDAVHGASFGGHIGLLDHLEAAGHLQDAQGNDIDLTAPFWAAAAHGRPAALDWLAARRPTLVHDAQAMEMAVTKGQTSTVRWLVERNKERAPDYVPGRKTATAAARHGHLDTLRYLCEPAGGAKADDGEGPKPLRAPTSDIYFAAAAGGHWHVVEWAASASVPWDVEGIVRWLLDPAGHSASDIECCVALIDRGFWRCSPWMRDLVATWPHAETAPDDGGAPPQHAIRAVEHFAAALAKALGSDSTIALSPTYMPVLRIFINALSR